MKLDKYEIIDETDDYIKRARTVNTPLGAESEENTMTLWETGGFWVKVSKVSDLGWRVTMYNKDQRRIDSRRKDTEDEALELAEKTVKENI